MQDRWGNGPADRQDDLDLLVHLSNRVGEDLSLVQPGGGNSSIKLDQVNPFGETERVLLVKGSGTDLRTIGRAGFTRLSMQRLAALRERGEISDEAMMEFMGACMLYPHADPVPSVETPLHSVLPHRVILHTHDVVTMSLTNLPEACARSVMKDLYGDRLAYIPYVRPGAPLARAVMEQSDTLSGRVEGAMLAHHGLVVWADTPRECYTRLLEMIGAGEEHLDARKKGREVFGPVRAATPDREIREQRAMLVLPVIRGFLSTNERVVLHWDDSPRILDTLSRERFGELCRRGVSTPEHILRAGRAPLLLEIDFTGADGEVTLAVRGQLDRERAAYLDYHRRHASDQEEPLSDWAKVILVPGLGMVTAFKDKRSARVAADCYRAVIDSLENAEAVDTFEFLPEADVFEFEHWPLERRKVDVAEAAERKTSLLLRHVALIIGAGSGIGAAAAERFAQEGAHVSVADLDLEAARGVADGITARFPHRAVAVPVDVRDEASIRNAVRRTVFEFGGLDVLFYTAGLAPSFSRVVDLTRDDLQAQLDVHFVGALLALREVGRVLRRQGRGGAVVCSVSKAALAPGKEAAAYGGSKAALLHALRIAALELGEDDIRVNAINADQVDTPLFRRFVEARARAAGRRVDEQLDAYRQRNALGRSLIPARDVAEMAVLLASRHFAHTTGDILTIDGGLPDAFPR